MQEKILVNIIDRFLTALPLCVIHDDKRYLFKTVQIVSDTNCLPKCSFMIINSVVLDSLKKRSHVFSCQLVQVIYPPLTHLNYCNGVNAPVSWCSSWSLALPASSDKICSAFHSPILNISYSCSVSFNAASSSCTMPELLQAAALSHWYALQSLKVISQ
jgi:hypothetical protein